MKPSPDLIRLTFAELVEDRERPSPSVLRGGDVAAGVVGIAGAGERACFAVAVADPPAQVERLL
jgi:hypothetical protein